MPNPDYPKGYWVKLHLTPMGNETGTIELDLNRVTEVWTSLLNGDLNVLRIRYDGYLDKLQMSDGRMFEPDGAIKFDKYAGAQFQRAWEAYRGTFQFEEPPPEHDGTTPEGVKKPLIQVVRQG